MVIKKTTDSQDNSISVNQQFFIKKLYLCKQCIVIKKQTKDNYPTQFYDNNSKDSDFYTNANKFGTLFSNMGQNLANKIPVVYISYDGYLKGRSSNSLFSHLPHLEK